MSIDPNYNQHTSSYCAESDKITFKVLVTSSGELIDMYADAELEWNNLGIAIINLNEKLPTAISLGKAYPKPFNPTTHSVSQCQ